ncbi:MAG: CehA/McbA family metallohydrolase [Actinomycetota bacterium]
MTRPADSMIRTRIRLLGFGLVLFAMLSAPLKAIGQPDAPRPKGGVWLAGDLHIHTCFSHDAYCGPEDDNTGPEEFYTLSSTVEEQFCTASSRELDFLAITDHNDVRSVTDPGFGACGVLPIAGYENSLQGHAQMLGARVIYDKGDGSAHDVDKMAKEFRKDGGVFQANHPADGSVNWPDDPDWGYAYDVGVDTVEVWNISTMWQPPLPSGSSNDDAIRYWEGWLDRGYHVGAAGGSDNHWKSTSMAQGPGQPTTWVYAANRSEEAILEGIRSGRTTISSQPPGYGGARIFLEADADGDGTVEAIVGDTIPAGAAMRARVENAPGAELHVLTTAGEAFAPVTVVGPAFERRFTAPAGATWVRAEVDHNDLVAERKAACDEQLGDQTTYCRSRLLRLAMSSAIYLQNDVQHGEVYVRFEPGRVAIGNSLVEREWETGQLRTKTVIDKRTGLAGALDTDFEFVLNGALWASSAYHVASSTTTVVPDGGLALRMELAPNEPWAAVLPGGITRTAIVYPGIAGFEMRTTLRLSGELRSYTLDHLLIRGAPQIHAFRAGYDWRGSDTPDWEPTASPLGGHHTGDHRVTTEAGQDQPLSGEGEWMSIRSPAGARAFMVTERVDYASTRMHYSGTRGQAAVKLDRDVIYAGPFESDVHAGSPEQAPMTRTRILTLDRPLDLEPVFTGFGIDADDEAWQHFKYLQTRSSDWKPAVVFNSNGVDSNRISTGAKDDMDLAEVQRQAEVAKRMGVETFILDDGWQAISGDWCPDSPGCPEPRGTAPRFPDSEFAAVREAIHPMDLGLWMTPMMFHPASQAHKDNPTWMCDPIGKGLFGYNSADADSSSNEAGIVPWNPEAMGPDGKLIDYIEGRIRRAITEWEVRYFKFDFMVWLDCAGANPVTMYEYRESFIRMLDRLISDYPEVTFQIDETNDYRLFPFESVYRGPSWYANGSPKASEALHNLWVLAPHVPGYTIGQTMLGQRDSLSTDYLMAVALASHVTFFTDLTRLTDQQVEAVARWTDIYKEHRERFATFSYPLLEDPLPGNNWTGLQPWNPDTGEGALLVFRQDSADETRVVPLRGIRGDGSFTLRDAETGDTFGVFSASELRQGISISLPSRFSAKVLLIDPA